MTRFAILSASVLAGWLSACLAGPSARADVPAAAAVGAKKFTESVLLAEMACQLVRQAGIDARRADLGGTQALWLALTQGDIQAYPEYTGTITRQILKADPPDLAAALAERGIRISKPLGFRNNYALGMRRDAAAARGIHAISQLADHPELRFGFTHEFLDRSDGWPGLKRHYQLPHRAVRGFNHTIAYRGLVEGAIDVMELYTTDGEIAAYDLLVLDDDRGFFPTYDAVWLYRADCPQRVVRQILKLEGQISETEMQRLNARVQQQKANESRVAAEFLSAKLGVDADSRSEGLVRRVARTTLEHLLLVVPSLAAAVLVAVPLGILAFRRPATGQAILGLTGVLQTIPSLALLLFMIPLMKALLDRGTGAAPAVAALFLYSLLPVVRNTHAGMAGIPAALRESAEALGLSRRAILWRIELPLASRSILAGIKTAAVINVGTATLGGFIGAGGYGRPILRGIDKFDISLMLEGAIPAALMALAVQALFEAAERALAPNV